MGKNLSSFMNPEFLEQYRIQARKQYDRHKNLFMDRYGIDIDLLNSYFPEFYNYIEKRQFREAYRCLKAGEANFSTEEQKKIYEKFEKICLNREEMATVKPGDWVKDDLCFICKVMREKNGSFLIKRVFDARRSMKFDGDNAFFIEKFEFCEKFSIDESNLDFFQKPTAEEQAKIDAHFASHPEDFAKIDRFTDKFLEYREKLLEYGMVSPKNRLGTELEKFYKYTSDETAFVINITDYGDYLFLCYGVCNASLAPDYRDFFESNGCDNDTMNIRRCIKIASEADEAEAAARIKAFFEEHGSLTKEEILSKSKELRKEFMKIITDKLKPLGFKKKSNHWKKPLENSFYIEFYADKSQYSDLYRFYIHIFRESILHYCYEKIPEYNEDCVLDGTYFNWQLTSREAFARMLDESALPIIEHILATPQAEWANDESISSCFSLCDRTKCEYCPFKKE